MMSKPEDHGAHWDDELAAFALDALEESEREDVVRHVAGCDRCAERLRWLGPAIDVIPATVAPQEPPPELRARLMEIVEREGAATPASAPAAPRRPLLERLGLGNLSLRPALAGLAVILLVAAGVVGYGVRDNEGSNTEVYAAVGQGPGELASGTLRVDGDSGTLEVRDLPATKPGEVYQAWVEDSPEAGGAIHPSSVFVVSEDGVGDVAIPRGLEDAERVMVTREPKGGSEKPHESALMTATLD